MSLIRSVARRPSRRTEFVDTTGVEAPRVIWFPTIELQPFLSTLGVVLVGMFVGKVLRLPAGNFLGTVILAVTLHVSGIADFQLPEWLLAASYMLIGWNAGLNFTRPILIHAFRALPQVLGSIVALMLFCAGLGWLISYQFGIDPLSAYLATSPGGMDTVAIVAAASQNVNLSFIMALQAMRLLFLLMFGPAIARIVAKWVKD